MKISLWYVLILIFAVTALQIFAAVSGHYDGDVVFLDKIGHVLSGVALGLLWIWILHKKSWTGSLPLVAISIALFSLLGSFIWELFEFFVTENLPEVSRTENLYSNAFKTYL